MITVSQQNMNRVSSVVLANAAFIATGVIQEVAGNDISTSINGSVLTNESLGQLVLQRIANNLKNKLPQIYAA